MTREGTWQFASHCQDSAPPHASDSPISRSPSKPIRVENVSAQAAKSGPLNKDGKPTPLIIIPWT